MTGRPAAACALYAGFLGAWALGATLARRDPGRYHALGSALLEATLLIGALIGLATTLHGHDVAVHVGYLGASVAILPVGWALSATPRGRDPLTLTVTLVALAVVILRVDATAE